MLLKACNRCGNLIPYGRAYCEACAPIVEAAKAERVVQSKRESDRRYNKRRDPKYGGFYRSGAWRRLARRRIQGDGYKCKICGKIATEVDHIVPIQTPEGWERRLDWGNLQSLCVDCHNKKHNRFKKRGEERGVGPDLENKHI